MSGRGMMPGQAKHLHLPILERFLRDEQGMVTHLALVLMVLIMLFSGLSLDTSNAWRTRLMLQTAADAAAHAGAMELPDETAALESALELAVDNLSASGNSTAISSGDVEFGKWDTQTRTFTAAGAPANAVRVTATRSSENSNAVPTFFLRLAGFESWNIQVHSIAYRASETCAIVDISTNGTVEFDDESDYYNGYCVEGNAGADLGEDMEFDDDVTLYVADTNDISFSGSEGMSTLVGRGTGSSSATLTYSDIIEEKSDISPTYTTDVETLADNYLDPLYANQPNYINTAAAVIAVDASDVKYTSFIPGRIYEIQCGGSAGSKAQFYKETSISEVVIVSECQVQLGKNDVLSDVILISRDSGDKSVYAAKEVELGDDDDCADGGGVQIYTAGDFSSKKKLEIYGLTISAVGKVTIKNKSNKIEGLRVAANGDITISDEADFGVCKDTSSSEGVVSYLLVD